MEKKPCPDVVKTAGAELMKLRRMVEQMRAQIAKTAAAVEATKAVLVPAGAKQMEYDEGFNLLAQLNAATFLPGMAHNSFRLGLGRAGFQEPTDDDLSGIIGGRPPGGGGR